MYHAMIDIETLGRSTDAVITSIGAFKFNPNGNDGSTLPTAAMDRCFHKYVSPESCIRAGMVMDPATIMWWMEQSAEARALLVKGYKSSIELRIALYDLNVFLQDAKQVWAHGTTFDIGILNTAHTLLSRGTPWHYRDIRDTRTLTDLAETKSGSPILRTEPIVLHDALYDCIAQAVDVQQCYRILDI